MSYNGAGVFTINTTGQPVVTGTTVSSTAFNTLTADLATGLTTALTKDGQSTPTANIKLGAFKITNLGAATLASDAARLDQIQGGGAFTFVTVAGTDTITGTTSPTLTAYATGNQFSFLVANTNTGAVTINVDALGAKAITRTGTTALVAGDMVAGQAVEIIYDGTRFQLINGNSFTNLKVSGTLSGALTNATGLPPSGVVGTAAILGANTFTAAQEWATGTAIASAATINLDTATGNRVHITGTTAITAVTLTRGPRTVIFDGILTLTHNATTNNLPGAASITTAVGDRAIYESDGTTVYCVSYIKVSGAAVVALGGITSVEPTITTSTTLTSASAGYLPTQMAAIGQAVTLPDATTMAVGSPKFYIDNSLGGYPVGIRNTSGTLLMGIAAGGTAFVSCESISTAAGVWSVTGTNLESGLITIDNTFSSTYASTVLKPFVALDDNKSIHFLAIASGFAAVAIDNTTAAVGTPVTVSATASAVPCTAFMITSTTAIVFYTGGTSGTLISRVISLSGATTLTMGTASSTLTAAGVGVENFSGAPKIAQLDSTHYLLSYATATGAGTTSVAAWEVTSGTTATLGSAVNIIAANNVINSTTTYALTATTGLVIYASGAGAPYTQNAVVISITGTTCTVGTPAATGTTHQTAGAVASCVLSSTKALLMTDANTSNVNVYAATISGTSVSLGTVLTVETGTSALTMYTSSSATRYNPHLFPLSASTALLWYFDSSSVSRAVVLSESAGTVTAGTIIYRSIALHGNAVGAGAILPQGTTEFAVIMNNADNSPQIVVSKISGTTITTGGGSNLPEITQVSSEVQFGERLTSGDYMVGFLGTGSDVGANRIEVFRSNGDFIKRKGGISTPCINMYANVYPVQAVSANRVVVLGASTQGNFDATQVYRTRLLNMEIAA